MPSFFSNGSGPFDNLVGQFSFRGASLFTLGNFSILTNFKQKANKEYTLGTFGKPYTLDNLNYDNQLGQYKLYINFDYTDPKNFALYGSLQERFRVAISYIIDNFPASIFVTNRITITQTVKNIFNYTVNSDDTSTFTIPANFLINNYDIIYTSYGELIDDNSILSYRNLAKNFGDFAIKVGDYEYDILDFTSPIEPTDDLSFKVKGNPFSGDSISFHIIPNYYVRKKALDSFSELEKYLLNGNTSPIYTAEFKIPEINDLGVETLNTKRVTWKTNDGYNPSLNQIFLDEYLSELSLIGSEMDEFKTNYLYRMYIGQNLKEYDTQDRKFESIIQIYGRMFDELKKFIDGLAFSNTVTYDRKNNVSDTLIKNIAENLGLETFDFVSDDDFMKSVFGDPKNPSKLTPNEVNMEFWRRLVINSSYLFKIKGTRKAIEFLLKFIGLPDYLYDLNEFVFLANGPLNLSEIEQRIELNNSNLTLEDIPVDSEGYPSVPPNNENIYFQSNGGYIFENFKHVGPYDFGSTYLNQFATFGDIGDGFLLSRIVDNKKSWIKGEQNRIYDLQSRETEYLVDDERNVLNVKNIEISLTPSKAIEYNVYDFYKNNSGLTINPIKNDLDISFYDFIKLAATKYINAKNRKTITDFNGGSYPTLLRLYMEYRKNTQNPISYKEVNKYLSYLNPFWLNLVEQFVPDTAIFVGGTKYGNDIFTQQKFTYKHGIDDGSEFQNETEQLIRGTHKTLKTEGLKISAYTGEYSCFLKNSSFILDYRRLSRFITLPNYNPLVNIGIIDLNQDSQIYLANNRLAYKRENPNSDLFLEALIGYSTNVPAFYQQTLQDNPYYRILFPKNRSVVPECENPPLTICQELELINGYCGSSITTQQLSLDSIPYFIPPNTFTTALGFFSPISESNFNIGDIVNLTRDGNSVFSVIIKDKLPNYGPNGEYVFVLEIADNNELIDNPDDIGGTSGVLRLQKNICTIFENPNQSNIRTIFIADDTTCLTPTQLQNSIIINTIPNDNAFDNSNLINIFEIIQDAIKDNINGAPTSVSITSLSNGFVGNVSLVNNNSNILWEFNYADIEPFLTEGFNQSINLRVTSDCDGSGIDLIINLTYIDCVDDISLPDPQISTPQFGTFPIFINPE